MSVSEVFHSSHMGGIFTLKFFPQPYFTKKQVAVVAKDCFSEVARIEDLLTEFRPSPFQLINENAGVQSVEVNSEIWMLFDKARSWFDTSQGYFDITVATKLVAMRNSMTNRSHLPVVCFSDIIFNKKEQTVFLPHKDMRITFGGLGKGHAVDVIYEKLLSLGMRSFSVEGSGDVRVHSHPDAPRAWRLGVRNPFNHSQAAGFLEIREGALCTSGRDVHRYNDESISHHIVDPKLAESHEDIICVSVWDASCLSGDIWGTTLMAQPFVQAYEMANKNDLFAFFILANGDVKLTERAFKGLQNKRKNFYEENCRHLSSHNAQLHSNL